MRDSFGFDKVRDKELAAPQSAIRAESKAIHRNPYHLAINLVVSHAARYVGVMMLNSDSGQRVVKRQSVLRREVFRQS